MLMPRRLLRALVKPGHYGKIFSVHLLLLYFPNLKFGLCLSGLLFLHHQGSSEARKNLYRVELRKSIRLKFSPPQPPIKKSWQKKEKKSHSRIDRRKSFLANNFAKNSPQTRTTKWLLDKEKVIAAFLEIGTYYKQNVEGTQRVDLLTKTLFSRVNTL